MMQIWKKIFPPYGKLTYLLGWESFGIAISWRYPWWIFIVSIRIWLFDLSLSATWPRERFATGHADDAGTDHPPSAE